MVTGLPFLQPDDRPNCMVFPELFFTGEPDSQRTDKRDVADVRNICGSCPWSADCLRYALDRPFLDGWWGGMSRGERDKIRAKGNLIPAHPKDPILGALDGWIVRERAETERKSGAAIYFRDYRETRGEKMREMNEERWGKRVSGDG